MLRQGSAIGAIFVGREAVRGAARPFSDRDIELLKTFAGQAVIAIENARLFEEVKARTRELQEALEYQNGTSEVLGVISRSKSDLQPVIDTIVATATAPLCGAERGAFLRFEAEGFRLVPTSGSTLGPISRGMFGKLIPFDRGSIAGRVALEKGTVHVNDMQADPDITLMRGTEGDTRRSALGVPLLGAGGPVGAIVLQRTVVKPFSDRQIELVRTFADQAVIAIENARLFEAEQTRTKELQESLEYQTATSEVLGVISRSPNELQPVLDSIVETAQRLCSSDRAQFFKLQAGKYHLAAHKGTNPEFLKFISENPISLETDSGLTTAKAARERSTVHVPDVAAEPAYFKGDIPQASGAGVRCWRYHSCAAVRRSA